MLHLMEHLHLTTHFRKTNGSLGISGNITTDYLGAYAGAITFLYFSNYYKWDLQLLVLEK